MAKIDLRGRRKTAGAATIRRSFGRRRKSTRNLLSLIALALLIALFLARRLAITPPARQMSAGAAPSGPAAGDGSGERLTPADRQSLDRAIRDKARP